MLQNQKAEAAAQKAAVESSKKAAVEDAEWAKGSKSNAKKEEAESKKSEAARKKAEKDALLAAEERSLPSGPKNTKSAAKKTSAAPARRSTGLNLDQLNDDAPEASSQPLSTLNATGIDNALDALSLTTTQPGSSEKIDRHPERRYKAAYAAYEARRMPELEVEMKGLRRQQRVDVVRKEFERSGENPFNQVSVGFDASREEVREVRERERVKVEGRLGGG
ncbi:MAG: hypothetical protein LQ350_008390 [Teloschistes chrysophthalmus]|nr:MAG: hypothetical protein LQ350_008390 [Niorma chrysophthalma]